MKLGGKCKNVHHPNAPVDYLKEMVWNHFEENTFVEKRGPVCRFFSTNWILQTSFFPLSDTMDLRHHSSAIGIIMLGKEDTHPWSATTVGIPILATIPVDH